MFWFLGQKAGILAPWPGIKPVPSLCIERWRPNPGSPGKSPFFLLYCSSRFILAPWGVWFMYVWSQRLWASLNIFIDHLNILLYEVTAQVSYPF